MQWTMADIYTHHLTTDCLHLAEIIVITEELKFTSRTIQCVYRLHSKTESECVEALKVSHHHRFNV